MDDYELSGLESHYEEESWANLNPVRGNVVEIFLGESNWPEAPEVWAAFLVVKVALSLAGGLVLEVKFIGAPEGSVRDDLLARFDRKVGTIHLCVTLPCPLEDQHDLHATRARLFDYHDFEAPYLNTAGRSRAKRLYNSLGIGKDDEEKEGKYVKPTGKSAPRKSALKRKDGEKVKKKVPPSDKREKGPEDERLTKEAKDALKDKLAKLRERIGVGDKEDGTKKDEREVSGEGVEEIPSSEEDESSNALEGLLSTGTELVPSSPIAKLDLGVKKKKKKRRKERTEVVSNVTTTKGLQGRLVDQAVAAQEHQKKGTAKTSGKTLATKMTKALVKILTKGSGKKEKKSKKRGKKDKEKKRKKRKTGDGGDPGGDGDGDSSTSSSEDDFSGLSDEENSSSEKEYEAPLRRKSKERPGSVLELLLQHARDQLDQSASVALPAGHRADAGIKLVSYFQILLRPHLGPITSAVREMYHICVVLDLLRRGQLDLMGDSLAARFLALHQSILDSSWVAAKHLEINALEETTAASTSLLLETRRHAKLAAKALGNESNPWGKGRRGGYGRGGKGKKGDDEWNPKGKGKDKGKKGRGRGNWNQGPGKDDWNKQGGEWGHQKETPSDK